MSKYPAVHKSIQKGRKTNSADDPDNSSYRTYVTILGVRVDSNSVQSLLRKISLDIAKKKMFFIVTPNPEQVMLAQDDEKYKYILNKADISLPDGVGIVTAYRFLRLPNYKPFLKKLFILFAQGLGVGLSVLFNRKWLEKDIRVIRGREFFLQLIDLANKRGWRVYLLGGEGQEADGTKKILERNYKQIRIRANKGPMLFDDGTPRTGNDGIEEKKTVKDINGFSPDLLFVGFGAPKQEKWLYRHYNNLKIGGAMVHGGTFKYISGSSKLPPNFIADLGLEWLWRLFTGSQKVGRIWSAFPAFPLEVFRYKLFSNK